MGLMGRRGLILSRFDWLRRLAMVRETIQNRAGCGQVTLHLDQAALSTSVVAAVQEACGLVRNFFGGRNKAQIVSGFEDGIQSNSPYCQQIRTAETVRGI